MNKRVKKLWIKALRGGKFKQGKGQLCTTLKDGTKKHCCLGVLEEIAVEHGIVTGYRGYDGELDHAVANWAGLNSVDPILGNRTNSRTAAYLNDRKLSFARIADRIEKYL